MIQVNARGMLAITPTITAITPKNMAKLDGHLQPPTKKNGKVTTLKSRAQELGFAFKSGNLTILLCRWL